MYSLYNCMISLLHLLLSVTMWSSIGSYRCKYTYPLAHIRRQRLRISSPFSPSAAASSLSASSSSSAAAPSSSLAAAPSVSMSSSSASNTPNAMKMKKLLSQLSEVQAAAVTSPYNSASLCISGPGSGKTKVLTFRIAYMLFVYNQSPYSILALTFTNKAANEMKERVKVILETNVDNASTPTPTPTLTPAGTSSKYSNNMYSETSLILNNLTIGTFHSFCSRLLRRYGNTPTDGNLFIKLTNNPNVNEKFSIISESDCLRILKKIMKTNKIDDVKYKPSSVLNAIHKRKTYELVSTMSSDVPEPTFSDISKAADACYHQFVHSIYDMNALDFEDLLILSYRLVRYQASIRKEVQERFKHILVDEYQDTNYIQYEFIKLISNPPSVTPSNDRSFFAVGDMDQSIYSWRGAIPENMDKLKQDYKQMSLYKLIENYRCPPPVADVANLVLGKIATRTSQKIIEQRSSISKSPFEPVRMITVEDAHQEAQTVAKIIKTLQRPNHSIGVMYRTNDLSRKIEEIFIKEKIVYRLYGFKFFERKEIKDILGYLQFLNNPNDRIALERSINTPPRGIGEVTVGNFLAWVDTVHRLCKEGNDRSVTLPTMLDLLGFLQQEEGVTVTCINYNDSGSGSGSGSGFESLFEQTKGCVSPRERKILVKYANILGAVIAVGKKSSLPDTISKVIEVIQYKEYLQESEKYTYEEKVLNIDELVSSSSRFTVDDIFKNNQLQSYIEDISLYTTDDTELDSTGEKKNYVSVMSIHGSKGLEFDSVFVIGCNEGLIPFTFRRNDSDYDYDQLEEEKRLFYVAITRTKNHLFLFNTRTRMRYTAKDGMQSCDSRPSPFLGLMAGLPKSTVVKMVIR